MSWASRRRTFYLSGVILFFALIAGIPFVIWWYEPATCFDGKQNQGETVVDRGGPCQLLDERALIPQAIQWARSFAVRDGSWSAVAYIENPNESGGVFLVPYRFKLYDDRNIIVAERLGSTYIMPNSITPVYEGGIDTGNRRVARTYFEFAAPLVWERAVDSAGVIEITGKTLSNERVSPRVAAFAENTSVVEAEDVEFVSVLFDPEGNAVAASRTVLPVMRPGEKQEIVFTWPEAFVGPLGRIDILPVREPMRPGGRGIPL